MSKRRYEDRVKNWKDKAISRRKENDYRKKREKELIESRDMWKAKYQAEKLAHKTTLILLYKIKKAIQKSYF